MKTKIEELTAIDPTFQSKTYTTILNNLLVPTKAKNLLYKTYQGAAHIGIVGPQRVANYNSRYDALATQPSNSNSLYITIMYT